MFSFAFNKVSKKKKDWKIKINDHEIVCSRKNAEIISKVVLNLDKNEENKEYYSINIPEFNDSFICSESDYNYFDKVFNSVPIQITNTNTEVLKIFATKFEIEELLKYLESFESYYNIITTYKPLQIQKDISTELINIEEESFDTLLNRFEEIEQNEEDNILTHDFLYNIFLNTCFIRPTKVELLINLLKKYEEKTKKGQFQSFKAKLLKEFNESNQNSSYYRHYRTIKEKLDMRNSLKTMQFILYYLCSIDEIQKTDFTPHQTGRYNCYYSGWNRFNNNTNQSKKFTDNEIKEYKKTGYCPKEIYHAIKKDDLELFTQMITQAQDTKVEFNRNIPILEYERNPDICYNNEYSISYLNLAAFYGCEQIFNYILLNTNPTEIEYVTLRMAFMGGNISIINKCLEKIEMDDSTLENCIIIAIKYNYDEVLEWLFENFEVTKTTIYKEKTLNRLIENAIKFNNIEVLIYFLSIGINHTSIFTFSLVYCQNILTKLAMELPYDCPVSSKYIKDNSLSPYSFKYCEVFIF